MTQVYSRICVKKKFGGWRLLQCIGLWKQSNPQPKKQNFPNNNSKALRKSAKIIVYRMSGPSISFQVELFAQNVIVVIKRLQFFLNN